MQNFQQTAFFFFLFSDRFTWYLKTYSMKNKTKSYLSVSSAAVVIGALRVKCNLTDAILFEISFVRSVVYWSKRLFRCVNRSCMLRIRCCPKRRCPVWIGCWHRSRLNCPRTSPWLSSEASCAVVWFKNTAKRDMHPGRTSKKCKLSM